jgi:hypothetical protein
MEILFPIKLHFGADKGLWHPKEIYTFGRPIPTGIRGRFKIGRPPPSTDLLNSFRRTYIYLKKGATAGMAGASRTIVILRVKSPLNKG